jgi:hypothetical protein
MLKKKIIKIGYVGFILLALGACEDNLMQKTSPTIGAEIFEDRGQSTLGDEKNAPGGNTYPYPDIIKREFIPAVRDFAHTKCFAWRITWPWYDSDDGSGMIPTVFSRKNGALNSFDYLNATDALNTYNGTMSLYYQNKLEAVNSMWNELDYSFVGIDIIEPIIIEKSDWTLGEIIDRVTGRPSLFKSLWPGGGSTEMEYEEGDFFQFYMYTADLYGGVRIVSMSPRIIEVYLAVPND